MARAFFALLRLAFGLTQYLQFVKNYTPLEAGLGLLPIAVGIGFGSGMSERAATRAGTKRVVTTGMLLLAGALAVVTLYQVDTPYWLIGTGTFLVAMAIGMIIAPSTLRRWT